MSPSIQHGAVSTSRAAASPGSQAGSATSSSPKKRRSLPWGTSYGDEPEGAGSGSGCGFVAKVKKKSSLSPLVATRDEKASSGGRPTYITNTPSSSSPTASRLPLPPSRPALPPVDAQSSSTFHSRLPPPPRNSASSTSSQAPSIQRAQPPTIDRIPSVASPLLPRPRPAPQRAAPAAGTGAALPGMKKRGPAPDSLLFGDDPPIKRRASETPEVKFEVKAEPRPALTQADTVLFSKATPVLQAPLFPKAVHSRSTGVIKRSAAPVDFKPLEDINREKQEFARRFPLLVPKKERGEETTLKSDAGDARGLKPVASTSSAKHPPLSPKQRKAVASGSSALTSSPPIHPRMEYSREDLDKRFGRPTFVSDGSDSSDEAVVVSSRSSSAPNRSRAASPSRGGGAGGKRLDKGKGKERGEHKVGKEKKAAKKSATGLTKALPRTISPALGDVAQQTDAKGRRKARTKRKPEEWYWRNLEVEAGIPTLQPLLSTSETLTSKRNLVDQPSTDERLLKVSITHVIASSMEVVLNEQGGWNVDLLVDLVDPDNPGSPLSSHDEQLRLTPSSLPSLPEGYAATSPDGANSASMILPFLLDSTSRPLQLILKLRVGQYTYSATTDIPTASCHTFDGTLPFSTSPDPTAGIRVSLALLSPRRRPSTTDAVLDGLTHRFERVELETGAKSEVWIPDPVKVEIPAKGGKEKEPVRMPDLGLRKGGYDFVTKEPTEAGDVVKLYEGETVESLSSIIAGFDRRIATSSLDFDERIIARAHQRFCALNPLPPTVALRELSCWRYYAPLLHHFHLRPKLAIHLIDRFKRRLISAAEMRDVLDAYDEEVKRVDSGERVEYEEWRKRVLAEEGG